MVAVTIAPLEPNDHSRRRFYPIAGMWLALSHPPIALATSTVLFVVLLYRAVTAPVLKSCAGTPS